VSTSDGQARTSRIDRDALLADLAAASAQLRYEGALHADALASSLGVSHADFACLTLLFLEGAATAGRISEVTGLSSGGVSGVIDRLERAGYARREADPADRRRVVVTLAADQRPRLDEAFAQIRVAEGPLFETYTSAELPLLLADAEERLAITRDETRRLRGEARDATPTAEVRTFSTPLNERRHARLEFVGGGELLRVQGDPDLPELFQAEFQGGGARAAVDDYGTVSIRSRSPRRGGPTDGTITLNASVQWTIQFRGGGGRIEADLRSVPLAGLEIVGGSGDIEVTLGPPEGHVALHMNGGTRHVRLHRPLGAEARLSARVGRERTRTAIWSRPARRTRRGVLSHLVIDGEAAVRSSSKSGSRWETPGHATAADRFDITVRGGAVRLELDEV